MIEAKEKQKIIEDLQINATDTGSAEVQIGLLSKRIEELTDHLKQNIKDHSARRGLLKIVARRRTLLDYLRYENEKRYNTIIKKIGLKK